MSSNSSFVVKKAEVLSKLERSTLMEELSCRQKSRDLWLREVTSARIFFRKWLTPTGRRTPLTLC
jgi:hypothetical protein